MSWHGVPVPYDSRDEWLTRRKLGIGASDVAGILGLSPWATEFTVWADKRADLEDEQTSPMYWGGRLEDVVTDEFERQTGLFVHGRQWLVHHPEHPWVMATIDGYAQEGPGSWDPTNEFEDDFDIEPLGLVEVKTDSTFGGWQDGVPDHYRVQVMWQMLTTGLTHTWVAVLHGGRNFQVYEVDYDEGLAEKIFLRVDEWRDRYIVGDEMPEADASDATARVLRDLWTPNEEEVIELSTGMAADLEALRGWRRDRDAAEEEVKRLEARLKQSMQEATVGTVGGFEAVTWKPVTSRRIDSTRLKEERPDVYEKFTKESTSRRFLVKEAI